MSPSFAAASAALAAGSFLPISKIDSKCMRGLAVSVCTASKKNQINNNGGKEKEQKKKRKFKNINEKL